MPRAAAGVAVASALFLAPAPYADAVVVLRPGDAPARASDVTRGCGDRGPLTARDTWTFSLSDDARSLVSISAAYKTVTGTAASVTKGVDGGHTAVLVTDAGWTLTGAMATVDGPPGKSLTLHLAYACPAPSPSASPSAGTASARPTPSAASPAVTSSPARAAAATPSTGVRNAPQPPGSPYATLGGKMAAAVREASWNRSTLSVVLLGVGLILAAISGGGFLALSWRRRAGSDLPR
jgi:hypothetical protein